jgi:hypothetical protein
MTRAPLAVRVRTMGSSVSGRPSFGGLLTNLFPPRAPSQYSSLRRRKAGAIWNKPRVHVGLALVHHPVQAGLAATTERKHKVRPNPSIERTSTGLAREAPQVHVPLRGPIRFRPAHVKR